MMFFEPLSLSARKLKKKKKKKKKNQHRKTELERNTVSDTNSLIPDLSWQVLWNYRRKGTWNRRGLVSGSGQEYTMKSNWKYFTDHLKKMCCKIYGRSNQCNIVFFSYALWILTSGTDSGALSTARGNHPTPAKLTAIYMYRCESPVNGTNSLKFPPKDGISLWFNYPIRSISLVEWNKSHIWPIGLTSQIFCNNDPSMLAPPGIKPGLLANIKRLDCVSNAGIHEMKNTQPIINTVRQHQLHFLGHILRMPDDKPCRRYTMFQLMPEGDQGDKGQATYHTSRSC